MPTRLLVADELILYWRLDLGMKYEQIIHENWRLTGNWVTKAAISRVLKKYGLTTSRKKYPEQIPWRVIEVHENLTIAQRLRAQGRRANGETLDDDVRKDLEAWEAKLLEANVVVGYDPETRTGFQYLRRRPEDGDGWVRKPSVPDTERTPGESAEGS